MVPNHARSDQQFALMSLLSFVFGGPVGSLAAIVLGWADRYEVTNTASKARKMLALSSMLLGFVGTCVWAVLIGHVAASLERRAHSVAQTSFVDVDSSASAAAVTARATPADGGVLLDASAPSTTTIVHHEGLIVVVDIGTMVPSLPEELAKLRADAARSGERIVVMTTRTECSSCRYFSESLRHPLMQTALAGMRLARIDVEVFEEDLTNLKIPHEHFPGFFLLAPDLFPIDGIDVDEWTPDSVANISSVVGSFVRGKYVTRRRAWHPVAENRLRL